MRSPGAQFFQHEGAGAHRRRLEGLQADFGQITWRNGVPAVCDIAQEEGI